MYLARGIENNYIYLGFESSRRARSFFFYVDGSFIERMEISRGENSFVMANAHMDGFYDGIFRVRLENGMHRAFFRTFGEDGKAYDTIAFPIFIKDSFACALCTARELDRGTVTPDDFFGYRTGFVKYNETPRFAVPEYIGKTVPNEERLQKEPEHIYEPLFASEPLVEEPKPALVEQKPAPKEPEPHHIQLDPLPVVTKPAPKEQEPMHIQLDPLPVVAKPVPVEPQSVPAETKPLHIVEEPAPAEQKVEQAEPAPVQTEQKEERKAKKHISGAVLILIIALLGALAFLFVKTEKFTNFEYLNNIKESVSTALSTGAGAVSEWLENISDKFGKKPEQQEQTEEPEPLIEQEEPPEEENKPENTYGHELTMDEVLKFLSGSWLAQSGNDFTLLKFSGFEVVKTDYTCKSVSAEEAKENSLCVGENYYAVVSEETRSGDYSISESDEKNNYGIAIILPPDESHGEMESLPGKIVINTEEKSFTFISDNGMRRKFVKYER